MTLEKRGGIPAEIRADENGIKVEGYAAVFGEETDIGGMFREVIERGAFKDAIGRDDVGKMSFAFYPEVQEWDENGDLPLRTIKQARLSDVSIVTTPAYSGTEIALRSLEASRPCETAQDFRLRNKRKLIK